MKSKNDSTHEGGERSKSMKKNVQRLGGGRGGLSLEAFANAKSKNNAYNPALLKRKREFYKNAKFVSKYKKMVKHENQPSDPSSSVQPAGENKSAGAGYMHKNRKNIKGSYSLEVLYEKKREEEEKARMEREAIIKAKKEEKEKAESRRKDLREKMYKKTRKGQPVMKYRIEHILETLQGAAK
ncbi:hypothetical protein RND81_05G197900 [Saponaria officinalis]|uniref:rRNA-processing protein FYV7 n=1 Tax=Saponaria officinalis TaxID=3572 RepID=A0AAW1L053_SAPOF